MSEVIRYTRLGKEDLALGLGTFEARLADGRVVVLSQIDIGAILSDAALSSQSVTLSTLTLTTATVSGVLTASGTLRVPEKADPGSPVSGEVWINSGGTVLEYADDAATPAAHELVAADTTQTLTNKTLTTPTVTTPVLSGTATGTYAFGGTPSLAVALDAAGQDVTALDEVAFNDAAANPTATGRLRRSGNELLWRQSLGSMRLFYGESGTIMLFQQTNAPTGWTKITTYNNRALRVVSGAASVGGAVGFTENFNTTWATVAHALTTAQMPTHGHRQRGVNQTTPGASTLDLSIPPAAGGNPNSWNTLLIDSNSSANTSGSPADLNTVDTGGGTGHSHNVTLDLQFVDIILATKD